MDNDNVNYLNQISASTKPSKKGASDRLFSPTVIKFIIGGVAAAILMIIVGSLLGGLNNKPVDLTKQLYVRSENLGKTYDTFYKKIKSNKLRSANSTFSSALTDLRVKIANRLADGYQYDVSKIDSGLVASETAYIEALNKILDDSNLNNILDRTYAREIAYQISLLISIESEISERTKDQELKTIVENSKTVLETLKPQFDDFSDTVTVGPQ